MAVKVNSGKDIAPDENTLLVQVKYSSQPIPNDRTPVGIYYSFKNKWVSIIDFLSPEIQKLVSKSAVAWGNITGSISNQTDLINYITNATKVQSNFASNSNINQQIPDGAGWVDVTDILTSVDTTRDCKIFVECKINCTKTGGDGRSQVEFRVSNQNQTSDPFTYTIDNASDIECGSVSYLSSVVPSGNHEYKLQAQFISGGDNVEVISAQIFVQALPV